MFWGLIGKTRESTTPVVEPRDCHKQRPGTYECPADVISTLAKPDLEKITKHLSARVASMFKISDLCAYDMISCSGAIFSQAAICFEKTIYAAVQPTSAEWDETVTKLQRIQTILKEPLRWACTEISLRRKYVGLVELNEMLSIDPSQMPLDERQQKGASALLVTLTHLYQRVAFGRANPGDFLGPMRAVHTVLSESKTEQERVGLRTMLRAWAVERFSIAKVPAPNSNEIRDAFLAEAQEGSAAGRELVHECDFASTLMEWGALPYFAYELQTNPLASYTLMRSNIEDRLDTLRKTGLGSRPLKPLITDLPVEQTDFALGLLTENPHALAIVRGLRDSSISELWGPLVTVASDAAATSVTIGSHEVPLLPLIAQGAKSAGRKSVTKAFIQNYDGLSRADLIQAAVPLLIRGDSSASVITEALHLAAKESTESSRQFLAYAVARTYRPDPPLPTDIAAAESATRIFPLLNGKKPAGLSGTTAHVAKETTDSGTMEPIKCEIASLSRIRAFDAASGGMFRARLRHVLALSGPAQDRFLEVADIYGTTTPFAYALSDSGLFKVFLETLKRNRHGAVAALCVALEDGIEATRAYLTAPAPEEVRAANDTKSDTEYAFPINVPAGKFSRIIVFGMDYGSPIRQAANAVDKRIKVEFPDWTKGSFDLTGVTASDLIVVSTGRCSHALDETVVGICLARGIAFLRNPFSGKKALIQVVQQAAERLPKQQ